MTTTPPTPALADLDLDLDELQALCDAVKRPWYGTCQIADGVTDEAAVAFIEAFSPDTVSELIALARRAAQPVAPVQDVLTLGKKESAWVVTLPDGRVEMGTVYTDHDEAQGYIDNRAIRGCRLTPMFFAEPSPKVFGDVATPTPASAGQAAPANRNIRPDGCCSISADAALKSVTLRFETADQVGTYYSSFSSLRGDPTERIEKEQPTYYIAHPDGSFSLADPQPKGRPNE